MAETSGFFDAEELVGGGYDREYVAEQWANYFKLFISNGVFVTPTNQLKVVSNSGMTVIVMAGWAWINGYWYNNSANYTLTIPANTSAATKKHGIFVQFDSGERTIKLVVGNERTTVNRTAPYYELKLAEIIVAPGVSAITTADITDTRGNTSVCGFVTGVVDVIDTGDLFAQFNAIFNNFLTASQVSRIQDEAAFDTWFNAMKGQLTTDAAGNLQTEIDNLEEALTGEVVDTEAYVLRQGRGNLVNMALVGGSLAWNQLIQNGNFANTSGWTGNDSSLSASGNVLTVAVGSGGYAGVYTNVSLVAGHKYLCMYDYKVSATGIDFYMPYTQDSISSPAETHFVINNTNWNRLEVLFTIASTVSTRMGMQKRNNTTQCTLQLKNYVLFDLTALFGSSTIADYIYSLEQATVGAGVAWFRKYFPNTYYGYNAGNIQSVNVGARIASKNLFNPDKFVRGLLDTQTGLITASTQWITSDYIPTFGKSKVTLSGYRRGAEANFCVRYVEYDANFSKLTYASNINTTDSMSYSQTFTTFANTRYIRASFGFNNETTTPSAFFATNDIQLEFGDAVTPYEDYDAHKVVFDTSKQLRGVYDVVNGRLVAYGDIYRADEGITRKYGIVDLGSLDWSYNSQYAVHNSGIISALLTADSVKIICSKYIAITPKNLDGMGSQSSGVICKAQGGQFLRVKDTNYTDAATFKTAMNGVYLVYELSTPTTESATAFQNPQRAFIEGKEEFIDYAVSQNTRDVSIPVGIDARYYLSEVLPAAEDYTDGAAEQINAAISLIQSDILGIISSINTLNDMYDGKAPSNTTNLNAPLALGGTKFAVHRFADNTANAPTSGSGIVLTWSKDANNGAQLVIAEDTMFYRRRNVGVNDSWQTFDFVTNLESTKTLSTTINTTYTFSSSMITANSVVDVYSSIFGVVPSSVSVSSGSCAVTFPPYTSAASMKCRIAVRR